MGEHRVPMLGSSWRRNDDPALSRDPRVRAVVGALAELPAPAMRPEFRAELRAQLVAITPRIVTESADGGALVDIVPGPAPRPRPMPQAAHTGAKHADGVLTRLRGLRLGRPLAVVTAVVAAFALLLGGAVVMSRKSLPGDPLYGLKRASERFELATAGSDTEKAQDYLNFATTRAKEVRQLLGHNTGSALAGVHAAGGVSAGTADLIRSTLGSADGDVRAAARLLGTQAVHKHSAAPLSSMTKWAPGQLQRLQDIVAAMPDPGLRSQAQSSVRLVQAAQNRAAALAQNVNCDCLGGRGSDELGPKPCTSCGQQPSAPTSSTPVTQPRISGQQPGHAEKTSSTPASSHLPGSHGGSTPVVTGDTGGKNTTGTPPSSPAGSSSGGGLKLPPLLPTGSSAPVAVNSCGASVSLPILGGVGLGLCNGVQVKVGS